MLPNLSCTTISSSHTVIYPNNLIDRSLGKVAQLGQLIQQFLQIPIPNLILQTRDQRFRLLRIIAAQTPYSFNSSARCPHPCRGHFLFSPFPVGVQTTRFGPELRGLISVATQGSLSQDHICPPLHPNSGPEKWKT